MSGCCCAVGCCCVDTCACSCCSCCCCCCACICLALIICAICSGVYCGCCPCPPLPNKFLPIPLVIAGPTVSTIFVPKVSIIPIQFFALSADVCLSILSTSHMCSIFASSIFCACIAS